MPGLRPLSTVAALSLAAAAIPAQDWADAPDPPYRSTQARDGAVHLDTRFEWLGSTVTVEPDARPANGDDDDGVHLMGPYLRGTTAQLVYQVRVTDAQGGRYGPEPARQLWVHGFADWNGDGDFDDGGEVLFTRGVDASTFAAGRNQQMFTDGFAVPDQPLTSTIWFRVRLDYGENLASPQGSAAFGEVEDWRTSTLVVPDQHATIQRAVDNAEPGDVIVIRPGTYDESVLIRKSAITLLGTPGSTILRGRGTGSGIAVVHVQAQSARIIGLVLTGGAYGIWLQRPVAAALEGGLRFDLFSDKMEGNGYAGKVDVDGDVQVVDTEAVTNVTAGLDVESAHDIRLWSFKGRNDAQFDLRLKLFGDADVKTSSLTGDTEANLVIREALTFTWTEGDLANGRSGMRFEEVLSATIVGARFLDHEVAAIWLPAATSETTFLAREVWYRSSRGVFFGAEQRANLRAEFSGSDVDGVATYLSLGTGLVAGQVNDRGSRIWNVYLGVEWSSMEPGMSFVGEHAEFGACQSMFRVGVGFLTAGPGPSVRLDDIRGIGITGDAIVARNLGDGAFAMRTCRIEGSDANKTAVTLEGCRNVIIDDCHVEKFKAGGIAMKTCSGTASDTTVTRCGPGITLDACTTFTLGSGNTVEGNDGDGVATANGSQSISILGSNITGNRGNGIRVGAGSAVTIRGNAIVGNGAHGVYDTGVAGLSVRDNKICCNSLAGVAIAAPVSAAISGNVLQANGTFEVDNRSPASIAATGNDWGPSTTVEMNSGATNISRIFDCNDSSASGCVTFRPWSDPTNTCEPDCFLLLGAIRGQWPIPFSPTDTILVNAVWVTGVTMATMPRLPIPADAALRGVHIFFQVYLHNPQAFPLDPVKTSNGIDVELDIAATEYGPRSGLTLWARGTPSLGSTLVLEFRIGQ